MQIHQFNVSYNDRQDRLLLRVNTQSGQEYRFWLTRRLTLRLVPALQQTVGRLEASQPQTVAHDPGSRQILTELKREAFLQKADFETPYTNQARQLPLGEAPMLVTDVHLQFQGAGVQVLLQDKDSGPGGVQSCRLHLAPTLLHGLIHLLQKASAKALWPTAAPTAVALDEVSLPATAPANGYRH